MTIKGKRTYLVSAIMVLVGLFFILFPPQATWAHPTAQTGLIIGILMIGYAAGTAATRSAIYDLRQNLEHTVWGHDSEDPGE